MLNDAWITGVSAIVFLVLEVIVLKPTFGPLSHMICKVTIEEDKDMHNVKADKMQSSFSKLLYYVFSVAWGYYVMIDQEYFPWGLGGKGDFAIT